MKIIFAIFDVIGFVVDYAWQVATVVLLAIAALSITGCQINAEPEPVEEVEIVEQPPEPEQ